MLAEGSISPTRQRTGEGMEGRGFWIVQMRQILGTLHALRALLAIEREAYYVGAVSPYLGSS